MLARIFCALEKLDRARWSSGSFMKNFRLFMMNFGPFKKNFPPFMMNFKPFMQTFRPFKENLTPFDTTTPILLAPKSAATPEYHLY